MTTIELGAMHALVALPGAIAHATAQLERIANALERMGAKDGPTVKEIVEKAFNGKDGSDASQED